MHGPRLDPFSSRLLAIRLKNGDRPAQPEPEPTSADLDDVEAHESYTPGRDSPDACAHTGDSVVNQVTAELLQREHRAVAPTGCHTCGKHAGEGDLVAQIKVINDRLARLERKAFPTNDDSPVEWYSLGGASD